MLHWGVDDFAIGEVVHVRIVMGNTTDLIYEGLAKVEMISQDRGFTRMAVLLFDSERSRRHAMSYEDYVRKVTKLDKYLAGIYD
jgi:hypothetical protein